MVYPFTKEFDWIRSWRGRHVRPRVKQDLVGLNDRAAFVLAPSCALVNGKHLQSIERLRDIDMKKFRDLDHVVRVVGGHELGDVVVQHGADAVLPVVHLLLERDGHGDVGEVQPRPQPEQLREQGEDGI